MSERVAHRAKRAFTDATPTALIKDARALREARALGYEFTYKSEPILTRVCGWSFIHRDYALGDIRHGHGRTPSDCMEQIREIEDELRGTV
jgi:hypothetical protein